jgi:acylphosphatase
MSNPIQRRIIASGRVQGVSYRASTDREASRYPGLRGFVRNLPDGRVEAVFSGNEPDVLAMVKWCSHGPSLAQVTKLEVVEEKFDLSLPLFEIRR